MKNNKYTYYNVEKKIICVSKYAGKLFRATASCSPADEYNEEIGRALAKARVDHKIATYMAKKKYEEYNQMSKEFERLADQMNKKLARACSWVEDRDNAYKALLEIEKRVK